jgi:hypothetical protein
MAIAQFSGKRSYVQRELHGVAGTSVGETKIE